MGSIPIGARLSPTLRRDVDALAAFLNLDLSDIVRNALSLYLQAHGYDQGIRIDAEATAEAQRRLREYEERAKRLLPAAGAEALKEVRGAAQSPPQIPFKTPVLQEIARDPTRIGQLQTALRMWLNPQTRVTIQGIAAMEAAGRWRPYVPPAIQVLQAVFPSYAALRDALVAETGVA